MNRELRPTIMTSFYSVPFIVYEITNYDLLCYVCYQDLQTLYATCDHVLPQFVKNVRQL